MAEALKKKETEKCSTQREVIYMQVEYTYIYPLPKTQKSLQERVLTRVKDLEFVYNNKQRVSSGHKRAAEQINSQ